MVILIVCVWVYVLCGSFHVAQWFSAQQKVQNDQISEEPLTMEEVKKKGGYLFSIWEGIDCMYAPWLIKDF